MFPTANFSLPFWEAPMLWFPSVSPASVHSLFFFVLCSSPPGFLSSFLPHTILLSCHGAFLSAWEALPFSPFLHPSALSSMSPQESSPDPPDLEQILLLYSPMQHVPYLFVTMCVRVSGYLSLSLVGRYQGCPAQSCVSGTSWNVWHFVGIQSLFED